MYGPVSSGLDDLCFEMVDRSPRYYKCHFLLAKNFRIQPQRFAIVCVLAPRLNATGS